MKIEHIYAKCFQINILLMKVGMAIPIPVPPDKGDYFWSKFHTFVPKLHLDADYRWPRFQIIHFDDVEKEQKIIFNQFLGNKLEQLVPKNLKIGYDVFFSFSPNLITFVLNKYKMEI